MKTVAVACLCFALATSAGAQQTDARWAPWLGCWQVTGGAARVCIARDGANGVTLTTRVAGEPDLEHTILADSSSHPINEPGCTGTQRVEWSADGQRLFTHADLACKDQSSRKVSGLSLMTANDAWLDVQAIEIAGQTAVRVRRYRRPAGEQGDSAGRSANLVPFTLEVVKEAAAKISPDALEAALTESGARFALNSRALVDLDNARVPGPVIDVIVALSYPEKFQVERRPEANVDSYAPPYLDAEQATFWGLGYLYDPFFAGYYGNYRYYSSPFAYGAYSGFFGAYYPGYYYPSVTAPAGSGTTTTAPPEDARVVNGVGYIRVRPREAQKTDADSDGRSNESGSGRATTSSSGYSSGSTQSSGSSSSGSSSSGSSSSGSDRSDGGRTAQPR